MKLGFIGLGTMGHPMCQNLLQAGYEVYVYDTNVHAMESLTEKGAYPVQSLGELAQKADTVFLSLPHGKIVEQIVEGLFTAHASKIQRIVDFSTIAPSESRAFAEKADKQHIQYIDCPVSGALAGAQQGTLTMMMGCDEEQFHAIEAPMKVMGKQMCFAHKVGNGSAVKLMNNYLVGLNTIMVCEVMVLAKKMGIDLHELFDIINQSSGRSFTTETLNRVFLDHRELEKGFQLDLLYKDLMLIMGLSKEQQFPLLMGANAIQILEMARAYGYGKNNVYGTAKMFEDMAKVCIHEQ